MKKNLPTSLSNFARLYAKIPLFNGETINIHLIDLTPGELNTNLWSFLNNKFDIVIKSLSCYKPSKEETSSFINPNDHYGIIYRSITNIYDQVDIKIENKLRLSESLIKSKTLLSTDGFTCYLNNSNQLAIVSGLINNIYPHSLPQDDSNLYNKTNEKESIKFIVPSNHKFVGGISDMKFEIYSPPNSSENKDYRVLDPSSTIKSTTPIIEAPKDLLDAYLNTLIYLLYQLKSELEVSAYKHLTSERKNFSYGLSILENFLPEDIKESKDSTTKTTEIEYSNVYFSLGLITRKESRASKLYPSVTFNDCETEFDAGIKLLNTSGIPYRVSEPPQLISDSRSYIFVSEDEKLFAFIRKNNGYIAKNEDEEIFYKDGDDFPLGQIITIYPSSSNDISPFEFLQIGMTDAWLPLGMIIATCLLLSAATLLPAFIVSQLTSLYIPFGDYYSLLFFGLTAIAVLLLIYWIQIIQSRYLVRFEIISDSNLQTMMIDRLLRIAPDSVQSYTPGSMQSRVLGISNIREIITSNLTPILTAYLSIFFNFVYLIYFSWQLSLIVFIGAFILSISTYIAAQQRLGYFKQVTELDGELLTSTNDAINGLSEMRAFGTVHDYFKRFTGTVRPLLSAVFNSSRLRDRVDTLSDVITYLIYIFLFPAAYYLANHGDALSIGTIIAFLTCTQTFLGNFESAIDKTITSAVQILTYWDRAREVINLPCEKSSIESTPRIFDGTLSVEKLSFSYNAKSINKIDSSKALINEISFDLSSGTSNLIYGDNSSGKSTLISLISGMHSVYKGNILVSHSNLKQLSPRIYRNHIANVPQNLIFMQGSLKNNLSSGLSIPQNKIDDLLTIFYLDDFIKNLPMGINSVVSPYASSIPILTKKKLFLLRAALKSSKYIFVDDCFTSMDSDEIINIINYFKSRGSTLLATSSDENLVKLFDQTINLNK